MANWLEKIALSLAPGLMNSEQAAALIRSEVGKEVQAARMAMPINVDYDPNGEGYRRAADGQGQMRRDLTPYAQDTMLEMAYYLYDTSGLVKRFVRDTKNFVLGEGVTYSVENDTDDGAAQQVLDDFWNDPMNQMNLRLEKRVEFLNLLGEQCWPVSVNPHNGRVWCTYVDPSNIEDVFTAKFFPELTAAVKLKGSGVRGGKIMPAVRQETDARISQRYGRLVGECFYFAVNNPPNGPRGRSDLIHLFDFINGFEEGLFDELDRIKGIKAFIWDVKLTGATDDDIKEFLRTNKPPKSNSVRAHNEQVEWNAVSPQLNQADNKTFFDLMKTYLAACTNRPDSWLGSGGKAYQTEADLMGEPTFKDLGSRQRYVKYMLEYVLKFVLDQAVIHKAIRQPAGKVFVPKVNMPEMNAKDLKKTVDGMFTLAQGLMIAETQGWISAEGAAAVFVSVARQTGVEVEAAEDIRRLATDPNVTKDYAAREGLIADIVARMDATRLKAGA